MKRRLVAGGCSLGHFPAGSQGTAANVSSAPVGISLLERWTESLTVNRMRGLIDALWTMTKAWSRGNTFRWLNADLSKRAMAYLGMLSLRGVVGVRGIAPM